MYQLEMVRGVERDRMEQHSNSLGEIRKLSEARRQQRSPSMRYSVQSKET
jgi:hypothetical protein